MIKQCVKKPYTVLVAVIICLTLAAVSLTKMTTDLLPEMNLPYMIVITTYAGASPEKVEANVSEPLEGQLGTVSNVKTVTSTSAENYSMVMLEFEDDTDMDSAMVKVNTALQAVSLPDECGQPNVMEISMDMMATQYLSISYDGKDLYELSDFVSDTITPYYERQSGVSNVTETGLAEKQVEVRLNQDKIDDINDKLLAKVNKKLADAKAEITDAQKELKDAKKKLKDSDIDKQKNSTANQLGEATLGLNTALATKAAYEAQLASQQANQAALQMELQAYEDAGLEGSYEQMNTMFQTLKSAATGDNAYQAMYSQIYQQILIATVQGLVSQPATPSDTANSSDSAENADASAEVDTQEVTVTADNVDAILDQLDAAQAGTADAVKDSCASAAKTTTEAQLEAMADMYPDSVSDAIKNPEKLQAAVELLQSQGQEEAAAQLTVENLSQLDNVVNHRIPDINTELGNLAVEIATSQAVTTQVTTALSQALESYSAMEAGKILAAAGFGSADAQIAAAKSSIKSGEEQLDKALESFEEGRETAIKNANIDALLKPATLSQMIYAQNFSMPAGYIDDKDDNQWMLKIGDGFSTLDELSNMLLCHIDGVGNVRLNDVADITVIDNVGDAYSKVGGNDAVVLALFKNSTSGTSEMTAQCNKASKELEKKYDGLHITVLMDQGQYISVLLQNIVKSMGLGAVLAVIVLAVFLKDVMPTLVVAFSIPFSVLVALLLMYFSDISLNIMSLSGLSLGIGMLVDNSIVVMENIYRLRNRGMTRARASVQGGRQVQGAIVASTLTTICVFLPMIFTSGTVRDMLLPFALTIGFALTASLVVALTVVPTLSSVLLRKANATKNSLFDKVLDLYGNLLAFCLKVKVLPLSIAVALLGVSIFGVVKMGIVMIPDMASSQIITRVTLDEKISKEDGYAKADEILNAILSVDGVSTVGAIGNASSTLVTGMSSDSYDSYSMYVIPNDDVTTEKQVKQICADIAEKTANIQDAEIDASSSAMGSMSSMLGSGLEVNIYGKDLDKLTSISKDFMDIIETAEGFTDVTNGQEDADQSLHLSINRDKAMKLGLTTAQIYAQIAADLKTDTDSITVTLDDTDMKVVIVDETHLTTKEKLLNEVFETTSTNDDGESVTEEHKLKEFGELTTADGLVSIARENSERYITVSATTEDGYNTTRLAESLKAELEAYDMPDGYSYKMSGEYENVTEMVTQMMLLMSLGFLFIYLVMVAQFQSLLSPFIVLFTVPLAFTGGFFGLLVMGEQLSMLSLMGFLVLMGTVVNNGIVFVDYANQLRLGGMQKRDALIATGKTRMRPILMTALTTILSMSALIFDSSTSAGMSRGMAVVVAGGLLYATLMTLFIIPVMYDILFRKQPREVDVGSDDMDDIPDDAAEFIAQLKS